MLQVCDDARAGAVLNELTARGTSTRQGTLYTLTVNTLAAADFLLTHAANPDRGATARCASSTARPGTWT